MNNERVIASTRARSAIGQRSAVETNKVIKNTYMLLSATFFFSAAMAAVSTLFGFTSMVAYFVPILAAFGLLWLVLPRTANSTTGIGVLFAITGLMGFALGPILNQYLSFNNGPQIIGVALGGTGAIFLGLSGYALTTRKDFSFMGGFLMVGLMIVLLAALANLFLAIPALSLALSAGIVLIMSGFILYETSEMVHRPESVNYIMMAASLFLSIFNIFVSLLQILGIAGGDD